MTKEQVIKVMEYFQAAFSGFYEGKDTKEVLTVWYDVLAKEDPGIVSVAAKNYVRTKRFPPTVADLLEQIEMIKRPDNDAELWAKIYTAASNGLYHADEEFNKLPPECQAFVGSPAALTDLAQTDAGTMNTVVKGQFLKRVANIREHQTVQNGLPMEVKAAIAESKRRMLLEEQI